MKSSIFRSERRVGVILSYSQTALSILIALIYMPVVLSILGKSEYGLYQTVVSVTATLSVLDLGFNGAYTHFYFKQKSQGEEQVAQLNGLFCIVYSILGTVAFLCCMYLTRRLDLIFGDALSDSERKKASVMLLFLAFNLLTDFISGTFSAYIKAQEKFIFSELLSLVRTAASPMLQFPLLLLGYGSVGITVARFAVNVLCNAAIIVFTVYKLGFRIRFSRGMQKTFFGILSFSSLIALNMVVDQINSNVDNIILARLCGTAEVAVNSVGVMIASYYTMFSTSVSKVYTPQIHRIVRETDASSQRSALTDIFTRVGRIQFMVLMLILSGFVIFGRDFITLWTGDGFNDAYAVCLLHMIPSSIPLIQNVGIEIQRAKRKHHYRAFIYSGMALANIALTLLLSPKFGAVGAAFATGAATFIANGIIMNVVYHKKINLDVFRFWKSIFSCVLGMLPPFVIGCLIFLFAELSSWEALASMIVIYTVTYVLSVALISTNGEEKAYFKDILEIKRKKSRP